MRILRRRDVERLLTPRGAREAMRAAFVALAKGGTFMPPRSYIEMERFGGSAVFMPAFVDPLDALGLKAVSIYGANPTKHGLPSILGSLLLFDTKTGETLALMDAAPITALRTAAVSALATDFLAREDAEVAGFLGAGVQARSHATALREVRPVTKLLAHSRTSANAEAFARWASQELGLEAHALSTPKEVVTRSDIVTTATPSPTPVLKGAWLPEGVHLNVIGSGPAHEVDGAAYARATRVVVDLLDHCLLEARDIMACTKDGTVSKEDIAELGDLIVGRAKGREGPGEITLFRSIGLAMEDAAAAKLLYDRAVREKVGTELAFP
ncbi:MAG: ornithine cyclodeaminase family protein [Thermoplasmata archaeon]